MRRLIILSGPIGAGKSEFAKALGALIDVRKVSTREYILATTGAANERGALQAAGTKLDQDTAGLWVIEPVKAALANCPADSVLLLDSARIVPQVTGLKGVFADKAFHIHLTASDETLSRRYLAREHAIDEFETYEEVRQSGTEAAVGELAQDADLVLQTEVSTPAELARVALAHADLIEPLSYDPLVDVFVGAQYGSEGKGNVCAFVAQDYDVLMRVGGPNAGHLAPDPFYKYVQLPSGSKANPAARLIIGAGSTLWLPQLMLEILDHNMPAERLSIDPLAMVIDDEDRRIEAGSLGSIASTKQGVGSASARKILGRGGDLPFGPPVKLARDVEQLARYVRDTKVELERAYMNRERIMLEGTQGTTLSIHHGIYPWVTSRETSVSGCLSDAGIAPNRVRKVVMVTRTYPIRVGGTSGWMGEEITLEEIADRSGISRAEMLRVEKGTISKSKRRVAEFDWMQLRRSAIINGATDIALTFADYLGISNRDATAYAELTEETRKFIERVERVTGAPVSLISKKFAKDGVIDRRSWK